jgi:hypothetical protein
MRYYRFKNSPTEKKGVNTKSLKKISRGFEKTIFFDDADGAADTRFEVLPYVDRYLKKQVLSDLETYRRELYGRQLFTDYHHNKYGIKDSNNHYRKKLSHKYDDSKIEVSWNLGAGKYPIYPYLQKLGVALARVFGQNAVLWRYKMPSIEESVFSGKEKFVHAHFAAEKGKKTIDFQRKLYLDKINSRDDFKTGIVRKHKYEKNMSNAMIALSPFGWGEICFRDFEAVLRGAALMKPDMSHLQTWPDIYQPYETYIPVSWDGSDIIEKAKYYFSNPYKCKKIAKNAAEKWLQSLSQIKDRVRHKIYGFD